MEKLLNLRQVAEIMGRKENGLRQSLLRKDQNWSIALASKKIKIGRQIRWKKSDLEKILDELQGGGEGEEK